MFRCHFVEFKWAFLKWLKMHHNFYRHSHSNCYLLHWVWNSCNTPRFELWVFLFPLLLFTVCVTWTHMSCWARMPYGWVWAHDKCRKYLTKYFPHSTHSYKWELWAHQWSQLCGLLLHIGRGNIILQCDLLISMSNRVGEENREKGYYEKCDI